VLARKAELGREMMTNQVTVDTTQMKAAEGAQAILDHLAGKGFLEPS